MWVPCLWVWVVWVPSLPVTLAVGGCDLSHVCCTSRWMVRQLTTCSAPSITLPPSTLPHPPPPPHTHTPGPANQPKTKPRTFHPNANQPPTHLLPPPCTSLPFQLPLALRPPPLPTYTLYHCDPLPPVYHCPSPPTTYHLQHRATHLQWDGPSRVISINRPPGIRLIRLCSYEYFCCSRSSNSL